MHFEQPPMDSTEAQNKMVHEEKERPGIVYEHKGGTPSENNLNDLTKKYGFKIREKAPEDPNASFENSLEQQGKDMQKKAADKNEVASSGE